MNVPVMTDKALIADLIRHRFTQFRHTKHGVLWGYRGYRFLTPRLDRGNFTGDSAKHVEARTREWTKIKEQMYGDMPGFREHVLERHELVPRAPEIVQVVEDPVSLLDLPDPRVRPGALNAIGTTTPPLTPAALPAALPVPSTPDPAPVVADPLPEPPAEEPPMTAAAPTEEPTGLTERDVRTALAASGGNRSAAADALRVSRTTLQRLITEYRLDIPLAQFWTCPYCRTQFKAQGKHLEACPAAKAAHRAASRMQRDADRTALARAANPTYVAPHLRPRPATEERPAPAQPGPERFEEASRPRSNEPDFTEADRPEPYQRDMMSTPLREALLRTAETGKSLRIANQDRDEGRRLVSRIEHFAKRHGCKPHVRRVNHDLYLWLERVGDRQGS